MIKEKAYKYKNYQISYDEGLKDRSALVIGIKEKDTLYIIGELYDESANAVIKILDDLESQIKQKENIIKEVREYIEQLLEYKKEDYYKGISLDYVERILDILEGDLKYE